MKNNSALERLYNGIIKENPTLVLILGMCPTLAVTTSAINGAGMGLSTTVVLMFSNMIISILRNFIPDRVRIPGYIVIIASLVTVVQFLLQGYVPALNDALGVYIPLIVVNCIILGRAESYASKNGPVSSFLLSTDISKKLLLEQQELPQAEQSPHPAGISSISPFFTLRFIILFLAATKQASTKKAPGARIKIVIGV